MYQHTSMIVHAGEQRPEVVDEALMLACCFLLISPFFFGLIVFLSSYESVVVERHEMH